LFPASIQYQPIDIVFAGFLDARGGFQLDRLSFHAQVPPLLFTHLDPSVATGLRKLKETQIIDEIPRFFSQGLLHGSNAQRFVELGFFSQATIPTGKVGSRESFLVLLSRKNPFSGTVFREFLAGDLTPFRDAFRSFFSPLANLRFFLAGFQKILELKHEETLVHMNRVAQHSREIALELWEFAASQGRKDLLAQLSVENLELLPVSASIHDLGKLAISDSIIRKPSRLTSQEFALIRTHPTRGREVLEATFGESNHRFPPFFLDQLKKVVEQHHERFDGSGYPHGLVGERCNLFARIVAIADVFDAITSDRVYKQKKGVEFALEEICGKSSGMFDPLVLQAFQSTLEKRAATKNQQKLRATS